MHVHRLQVNRKDELLKVVHRVLFKSPGAFTTAKQNILKFSGFPSSGDAKADEQARLDRATKLRKLDMEALGRMGEWFDIHRAKSGTKEERISRILDFLDKPQVGLSPSETSTQARCTLHGGLHITFLALRKLCTGEREKVHCSVETETQASQDLRGKAHYRKVEEAKIGQVSRSEPGGRHGCR